MYQLFSNPVIPHSPFFCFRTIPIAKRRYYGRVQQGVHDFLAMGPELVKAKTSAEKVQFFFDTNGVVVVEARRQDSKFVLGTCLLQLLVVALCSLVRKLSGTRNSQHRIL